MKLGEVMRAWRERQQPSIGVRDAAKMIGVSSATLSRMECGYPVDGRTLVKLLDWLLH